MLHACKRIFLLLLFISFCSVHKMSESAHLLLATGLLFFDMKQNAAIDGLKHRQEAQTPTSPNGVIETFKEDGLVYTTHLRVSGGGSAATTTSVKLGEVPKRRTRGKASLKN
jgi:hypothetical protein